MPQKAKSKTSTYTAQTPNAPGNFAEAVQKNFEKAARTRQRLQEEAGHCWSRIWNQGLQPPDWQKRVANFNQLASEMMPMAQKRMEEVMDIMQRSSRTGAELAQKAVDASQTPAIADSQAKWMDFWTASLKASQTHVEAVAELSTNALDSWLSFIRRHTEVTEMRVPRTA